MSDIPIKPAEAFEVDCPMKYIDYRPASPEASYTNTKEWDVPPDTDETQRKIRVLKHYIERYKINIPKLERNLESAKENLRSMQYDLAKLI